MRLSTRTRSLSLCNTIYVSILTTAVSRPLCVIIPRCLRALGVQARIDRTSQPGSLRMAHLVIASSHKPNKAPEQLTPAVLGSLLQQLNLRFVGQSQCRYYSLLQMQPQRPRSIVERFSTVRVKDASHLLPIVRSITPPINDPRCLEEMVDTSCWPINSSALVCVLLHGRCVSLRKH